MRRYLLFLLALPLCAAPTVTVSASAQTLLGNNQSISITLDLVDPNNTGLLRVNGTNIIPIMTASTVTPGATATVGPVYGNDVIKDGFGNLNATYYRVRVFTVINNIISSTAAFQQFFAFTGAGTVDLATATPVAPSFMTGTNGSVVIPGSLSTGQIGKTIIVDGNTYPKTDAGINAAIAAAGCGGHVFMPSGTYVLSDITRPQEILITSNNGCGLELNGEGGESTILQVAANVPATEDIIRVAPTVTNMFGLYLHDFYITPISGTPARYGINFDETGFGIAHVVVDRVRIGTNATTLLGSYAIYNTNTLPQCNSLFLANFHHNTFWGGVNFNNIGDSVVFSDGNNVTGPRDFRIQTASQTCHLDGGTHGFTAEYNNLTPVGGIVITNAWQGRFAYNDVEAAATSTEVNNAMIDLQGTAGAGNPTENFVIEGNYLGASNLFVADAVRVDQAYHTIIKNNYCTRGTGVGYRITANAVRTEIIGNTQAPNGDLITQWLSDSGTLTTVESMHYSSVGGRIMTNTGFGTTGSSNANFYWSTVQGKANSSSLWGWTSAADASNSGLDTGLSRDSAGVVDVGNGVAQDVSGTVIASKYQVRSNSQYFETTAPSAVGTTDICYGDSTLHAVKCSYNGGTFFQIPQVITATSSAFATATTAGTCVQNTTAVTGAATTMAVSVAPVSTPGVGAVWSGFVSSSGNVTINECAVATSAGGSIAFNIRVTP